MPCCKLNQYYDVVHNLAKEYPHWNLVIVNREYTLGTCVAILKRHTAYFSELTEEEKIDMWEIQSDIENSLDKSFFCENIEFKFVAEKDGHLHMLIIPRYPDLRAFGGRDWIDKPDEQVKRNRIKQEQLDKVKEEIIKNI